jgi:putative proteasome-type protease
MTFCIGIKVNEGLVGVADTRISSGTEVTMARKLTVIQGDGHSMFIMTSGLRSLRDKTLAYFEELLRTSAPEHDKLYKAVNLYTVQQRRVEAEDKHHLTQSGLRFDLHTLIGGQIRGDSDHKLFLVYPEGNWVEIGHGTPYQIIGNAHYGKPFLDRTLRQTDPLEFAIKAGCIAFDSTRISASDVEFPIDVVAYRSGSFVTHEHRFLEPELVHLPAFWGDRLRQSVADLPPGWIEPLIQRIASPVSPGGRDVGDRRGEQEDLFSAE